MYYIGIKTIKTNKIMVTSKPLEKFLLSNMYGFSTMSDFKLVLNKNTSYTIFITNDLEVKPISYTEIENKLYKMYNNLGYINTII